MKTPLSGRPSTGCLETSKMERVQRIYSHPIWQTNFLSLQEAECDRVFCRHTMAHFMDVARIAYIEALEKNLPVSKQQIYAAALLHDIGRAAQYKDGTPHELAGEALSREILAESGFSCGEQAEILAAIAGHRNSETGSLNDLAGILYRADKASRMCMDCPARKECNWSNEKKNLTITV